MSRRGGVAMCWSPEPDRPCSARSRRTWVVMLGLAVVCVFVVWVVPAWAAAPEVPEALAPEPVFATVAHLRGVLDPKIPEGTASEVLLYEFVYRESTKKECGGAGEVRTTQGMSLGVGEQEVSQEVTGLKPSTEYAVCVVAHNSANPLEETTSPAVTFKTMVAEPTVEVSVSNIASTSATLDAYIDPEGGETSYQFELAPQGGSFSPVAEPAGHGSIPEGTKPVPVSVHVQHGLVANTAYQLRVLVINSAGEETSAPVSFTTQRETQGVGGLPDSRAWELVSPPDRRGAAVEPADGVFGPVQGAADGGAIAYGTTGAIEDAPEGNRVLEASTVISTHGPAGWTSRDIATENEAAGADEDRLRRRLRR